MLKQGTNWKKCPLAQFIYQPKFVNDFVNAYNSNVAGFYYFCVAYVS